MTSTYRRDHILSVRNDEYERLSSTARSIINNSASFFEGQIEPDEQDANSTPTAGQRVALKRAMARFVIDSGIASARGWV